jgi:hypothetical protein
MAFHAILEIADSFPDMLPFNFGGCVFMTTVTGVLLIIFAGRMTGAAACPVITIETEIPVMIEGCGFPATGSVAGGTI